MVAMLKHIHGLATSVIDVSTQWSVLAVVLRQCVTMECRLFRNWLYIFDSEV